MKVVHFGKFYPPYRGGMETFLKILCEGLIQRKVGCEVIAAEDRMDHVANKAHNGVPVHRLRSLGTIKSTSICPNAPIKLRKVQADIINIHHPNPLADFSFFLANPKSKLVVTYHSDILNKGWVNKIYAPLMYNILGRADAIVATSAQYANSSPILRKYQKKVHIIPLGFDCSQINGYKLIKNDVPRFIFVGRLVPYKGISVMIDALKFVSGNLWVVGTGASQNKLEKRIIDSNLEDRVEFLGNISDDEKFKRIAESDVFVLPSVNRAEAFGIVLLEAMAVGRPVVVSDLPTGVAMLVEHGVNGFRFPIGNAKALAKMLETITTNETLARSMGAAGKRMVRQFSADRMVDAYFNLYNNL